MAFSGLITAVFLRDMGKVGAKKAKKVIDPVELEEVSAKPDKRA